MKRRHDVESRECDSLHAIVLSAASAERLGMPTPLTMAA